MKIPFDIKYRPQIESGDYKVFAHEHEEQEVRIVCWDNKGEYPIVALIDNEPEKFDKHGRVPGGNRGGEFSLFIVTPEEELSKFDDCVRRLIDLAHSLGKDHPYNTDKGALLERYSAELLSLAREQFIKDGYIIEKKAFHDAVENISDKHRAQMSVEYSLHCKVENGTRHAVMNWEAFQKVAQKFINIGKAEALRTHAKELTENLDKSGLDKDSIPYHLIEFMCNLYDSQNWKEIEETAELYVTRIKAAALKDLPRWGLSTGCFDEGWLNAGILYYKFHAIPLKTLEKLPGFKED